MKDIMKEIVHEIRSAGVTFTQEQWSDYCHRCRQDEANRIVTRIGKYDFNDCDVCLNPEVMSLVVEGRNNWGYRVTLKWCEGAGGLWSYGVDYNYGTGGGGFSPSYCTEDVKGYHGGFPSEFDVKMAAVNHAINQLQWHGKVDDDRLKRLLAMCVEWKKELKHPKPVQLSLFD